MKAKPTVLDGRRDGWPHALRHPLPMARSARLISQIGTSRPISRARRGRMRISTRAGHKVRTTSSDRGTLHPAHHGRRPAGPGQKDVTSPCK